MRYDHSRSFGGQAETYARHRPTWPPSLFDWLAEQAPSRRFAIDVATGPGQGALGLAEHFDRVLAVDQSAELLAQVPAHPRVRLAVADAASLDRALLADEPLADAVIVLQALHWFAGEAFNAAVDRALTPGGLFLAAVDSWFTMSPESDQLLEERLLRPLQPHWSPRTQLLLDGYQTLSFPWPEIEGPPLTLELDWTRAQLLAYLGTWSAVAHLREVEGRDIVAEFAEPLAALWPEPGARQVRMPVWLRAFRKPLRSPAVGS